MIKYIVISLLSIYNLAALENYINIDKLVDAIYRAENSKKYPYGIKSIDTHSNAQLARHICIVTIKNNLVRYSQQSKRTNSFIEFLGNKYAPIESSKLNKNWVKNVTYFYTNY